MLFTLTPLPATEFSPFPRCQLLSDPVLICLDLVKREYWAKDSFRSDWFLLSFSLVAATHETKVSEGPSIKTHNNVLKKQLQSGGCAWRATVIGLEMGM